MEKKRVVIADDNAELRRSIAEQIRASKEFQVVGQAEDGVQALEMVRQNQPDVLLLDLVMPKLDGFGVMEALGRMEKKPVVIVVSAMVQEIFVRRSMEEGARYFIAKPCDINALLNRMRELFQPALSRAVQSHSFRRRSLDEEISTVFITIGIPAHIKGFQFLREAIKLVMDHPHMINRITKELYPGIAGKFNTTSSKVERAIRHAIEVAWTRGKMENINNIFGYKVYGRNDKPTNGEFIALIADKLQLERAV